MRSIRAWLDKRTGEPFDLKEKGLDYRVIQQMTVFAHLLLSSLFFAVLFEWDRYSIIIGPTALNLTLVDKGLVVLLLTAKTLVWFIPLFPFLFWIIQRGACKTANLGLNVWWICVFYLMATDLVSVGFAGYHLWDYYPYFYDILENPGDRIWQWAGERCIVEAGVLLLIFVVVGPLCYYALTRLMKPLALRMRERSAHLSHGALALTILVMMLGVLPFVAPGFDSVALERIVAALPFTPGMRSSLNELADAVGISPQGAQRGNASGECLTVWPLEDGRSAEQEHSTQDAAVSSTQVTDRVAAWVANGEHKPPAQHAAVGLPLGPGVDARAKDNGKRSPVSAGSGIAAVRSGAWQDLGQSGDATPNREGSRVDESDALLVSRQLRDALNPPPADLTARARRQCLPNVILIIFESFRPSEVGSGLMKGLQAWARKGLRLERHYSGSNCSHLGLFSLFYARTPLGYAQTLDRKIPAQMFTTLRQSGYRITFLTSGEIKGFRRVDQWINDQSCDAIVSEGTFKLDSSKDWPDADRGKLNIARDIVNGSPDQPQFVFFYVLSSHYPYAFPSSWERFPEPPGFFHYLDTRTRMSKHTSRYSNALLFLEHEVLNLTKSIDPEKNIVIVTGDHGESMGEDGVFTHGSRMSEAQLRVPLMMVGPGVPGKAIQTATSHTDLLPTLMHALEGRSVPIAGCQGRDLIGDPSPADAVAVVPAAGIQWDGLLVINGSKRMAFRTSLRSERSRIPPILPSPTQSLMFRAPLKSEMSRTAQFAGFVDEAGHITHPLTPEAAAQQTPALQ